MRPWERQSEESEEAYRAFLVYRDMGPDRTLESVGQRWEESGTKTWSLISRWSSQWSWVDRCCEWDNHLQRAKDRLAVKFAEKWERRRLEMLDQHWEGAERLLKRVEELLAYPISEIEQKVSKDGKTIFNITVPARWNYMSLAQIMRLATEIRMATINEALPRTEDDGFVAETASLEELEKLAGRKSKGGTRTEGA